MMILVSCLLLLVTALALIVLRVVQPNARYTWLAAVGGGILALASVFLWLAQMPFVFLLPAWKPLALFATPILFSADGISWALAVAIAALTVSTLLTAAAQPVFTMSFSWVGTLALGAIGILAVTADNPLTLLLVWAALDITELVTQLGSVNGPANNEKVVISFSTRALGIGLLIWASVVSAAEGNVFEFESMPVGASVYLVVAAGLRLGVLPLHLPYSPESRVRRGFGTPLRLVSAVSSLVLLGRIPAVNMNSGWGIILMILAVVAALYGGWMWLRAPDDLNGRPYWVIGVASLSVVSALSGNPVGAVAWGCALILVGGALFLASVQNPWLSRAMLVGAWSLSTLPFSLTASAWISTPGLFTPFIVAAHALIVAGFIRHALRPSGRDTLDSQPGWTRAVYPAGIYLLIITQLLLGWIGWQGAAQIGAWLQAIIASLLTFALFWATRRFRIFNPVRAHWVTSTASGLNSIYQGLWDIYRTLARMSHAVTLALEGEGGIMWTLLFLALFVSLIVQGTP